jgi:hypothetical protein
MFAHFFTPDPLKKMSHHLARHCPDPKLWPLVQAYLCKGRRSQNPKTEAIIRTYLDLREALGARAAFKAGAELSHQVLAPACRSFLTEYRFPRELPPEELGAWACFCLAADFLLGTAFEARLKQVRRSRKTLETDKLFKQTNKLFFRPMAQEAPWLGINHANQKEHTTPKHRSRAQAA